MNVESCPEHTVVCASASCRARHTTCCGDPEHVKVELTFYRWMKIGRRWFCPRCKWTEPT